jgi:two-component sensor histidine kinase
VSSPVVGPDADPSQRDRELQALHHRLNNQLGVVLAQAELLESKAADDSTRNRAAQLVAATLAALATVRELRQRINPSGDPSA